MEASQPYLCWFICSGNPHLAAPFSVKEKRSFEFSCCQNLCSNCDTSWFTITSVYSLLWNAM